MKGLNRLLGNLICKLSRVGKLWGSFLGEYLLSCTRKLGPIYTLQGAWRLLRLWGHCAALWCHCGAQEWRSVSKEGGSVSKWIGGCAWLCIAVQGLISKEWRSVSKEGGSVSKWIGGLCLTVHCCARMEITKAMMSLVYVWSIVTSLRLWWCLLRLWWCYWGFGDVTEALVMSLIVLWYH